MIEEFYKKIEGDYEKAISRMQNDERIKKYLGYFLQDNSYEELIKAMNDQHCEEAFRAAHTLKGVCQNMSFDALSRVVEEITEKLRANHLEEASMLLPAVIEAYQKVIEEVKKII